MGMNTASCTDMGSKEQEGCAANTLQSRTQHVGRTKAKAKTNKTYMLKATSTHSLSRKKPQTFTKEN